MKYSSLYFTKKSFHQLTLYHYYHLTCPLLWPFCSILPLLLQKAQHLVRLNFFFFQNMHMEFSPKISNHKFKVNAECRY